MTPTLSRLESCFKAFLEVEIPAKSAETGSTLPRTAALSDTTTVGAWYLTPLLQYIYAVKCPHIRMFPECKQWCIVNWLCPRRGIWSSLGLMVDHSYIPSGPTLCSFVIGPRLPDLLFISPYPWCRLPSERQSSMPSWRYDNPAHRRAMRGWGLLSIQYNGDISINNININTSVYDYSRPSLDKMVDRPHYITLHYINHLHSEKLPRRSGLGSY